MALKNNRLENQQYIDNFADVHPPFLSYDAAAIEANRCLFCYDAPCTKSCPTSIDVPKFIKQIATENIKGSAHTILSSNILGAGCSRVCPVEKLCEGACVYHFLGEEPINIAKLQRYSTEQALEHKWQLFKRQPISDKKVAIVGAGPAGLSCAHSLSKVGVNVTIFEKEKNAGGLMTYGIAAYKVTPQFCEDEVNSILSIGGIEIKYNQTLGIDFNIQDLMVAYDAVYLAFGVGVARRLDIPGEDMEGVIDAISFIYNIRTNEYKKIEIGDKVAVIGMGMTAIDAATQSKRLGAKEVTIIYRRTENEMPCTKHEYELAKIDGCQVVWLASPKEILGRDGKCTHLVCNIMELDKEDTTGRRNPIPTGETFTIEADMVIKAAGQMPYFDIVEQNAIGHKHGKIGIGSDSMTNKKGVFAGGDCVNGGKEVVDAVQAGKDGAKSILEYLGIPLS